MACAANMSLKSLDTSNLEEDGSENPWEEALEIFRQEIPIARGNTEIHEYTYRDVTIQFPYAAYDSQKLMMQSVIAGVKNHQNCLLESPTGTGKTAALLCSLLAWKTECIKYGKSYWELAQFGRCSCGFDRPSDEAEITEVYNSKEKRHYLSRRPLNKATESANEARAQFDEVAIASCSTNEPVSKKIRIELCDNGNNNATIPVKDACKHCQVKHIKPRIYYATRTHSQIKQVVKQLQETHYNLIPMTILASRSQTCINQEVTSCKTKSIDDYCQELRELRINEDAAVPTSTPGCGYYDRTDTLNFGEFPQDGNAWDIEDLIKEGKKRSSCPYYGTRELQEHSEIVFCSYNYLIYPYMSRPSNIILQNSVVVFDEAHNIEQLCRDAASEAILLDNIDGYVRQSFDAALLKKVIPSALLEPLKKYSRIFMNMSTWIKTEASRIVVERDKFTGYFEGQRDYTEELIPTFVALEFGKEHMQEIRLDLDLFFTLEAYKIDDTTFFRMDKQGIRFLNRLWFVLNRLYRNNYERIGDYRVFLLKKSQNSVPLENNVIPTQYKLELKLICLNPAIMFEKLKTTCRSIIVTSGTLSPIESFASELDTDFAYTLQAPHVVHPSRVCAQLVLANPYTGSDLLFNSVCQKNVELQENLGNMIVQICQTVPNGVLVFLPSYTYMHKLRNRWRYFPGNNPILHQLKAVKHIFFEETNIDQFKKDMKHFRDNVHEGCVLFAVLRGKVSEGVDFKDEQARAVITVGIPYLPPFVLDVKLKMEYNDKRIQVQPNYLGGQAWYNAQAYRAINQGFGRCIRHKDDWGIIFILDSRIHVHKNKLSKWVKDFLKTEPDFNQSINSVKSFLTSKITLNFLERSANEESMVALSTENLSQPGFRST